MALAIRDPGILTREDAAKSFSETADLLELNARKIAERSGKRFVCIDEHEPPNEKCEAKVEGPYHCGSSPESWAELILWHFLPDSAVRYREGQEEHVTLGMALGCRTEKDARMFSLYLASEGETAEVSAKLKAMSDVLSAPQGLTGDGRWGENDIKESLRRTKGGEGSAIR